MSVRSPGCPIASSMLSRLDKNMFSRCFVIIYSIYLPGFLIFHFFPRFFLSNVF